MITPVPFPEFCAFLSIWVIPSSLSPYSMTSFPDLSPSLLFSAFKLIEPKWKINHNKVSINYNIYILNITFLRIWVYPGLDISCLYSPYTPQFPPGLPNWIITPLITSVALSRFYFMEVQWCATYTPSGKDLCPSCWEWCQHWPPVVNFVRDCLISNNWLRWRWGGGYKAPLFLFKAGELRWVSLAPQHIVEPARLTLGLHRSSTPSSVQSHFLLPSTGRDRRAFPNKERHSKLHLTMPPGEPRLQHIPSDVFGLIDRLIFWRYHFHHYTSLFSLIWQINCKLFCLSFKSYCKFSRS